MKQERVLPVIDLKKCSGCNKCIIKCKHNVLELIDIRTPKEKNSFFSHKKLKANIKNPLNCKSCGVCISVCRHKAIVFGKKSLILICYLMATINAYSNQIAPDSLSVDEAIRIGMKNNERKETISIATYETELIINIISKYNNLLFQQEYYKFIEKTKWHMINEFRTKKIKPRRRAEYNLHIQSIVTNLDIMLLIQYQKVSESMRLLNEIIGVSKIYDFFLSTPFDNVYTTFSPSLDNKIPVEIIMNYNNQVALLQQLSIRKQLSKYKLNDTLEYYKLDFAKLQIEIKNDIYKQLEYLTHLLKLKEMYNMLLRSIAICLK